MILYSSFNRYICYGSKHRRKYHPKPLYLVASAKGANIRTSIPSGTPTFVPAGAKMKVEELIPGFQSDGYQWVKASYNKNSGYVQVDLNNWHYFQI